MTALRPPRRKKNSGARKTAKPGATSMDPPKQAADKHSDLRKKAEKKLRTQLDRLRKISGTDVRGLVQELGTHQIELEMQIEELERAQAELEASRGKYADLYDFAPIGYFTLDGNGLIREVNLTGARLLGVARRFLINKPFSAFLAREGMDAFRSHCASVLKDRSKQTVEVGLKRRDKSECFVLLESIAAEAVDGNSLSIRTAVSDITERKQAGEALRHSKAALHALNAELELRIVQRTRFYAVRAQVNAAIVRHQDRQFLLNELCRIIVATGEFRLAWVGLLDQAARELRPFAAFGETGYLDGITIVAGNAPENNDPAGQAVFEDRRIVSPDFEAGASVKPGNARTRKHGTRSSAAFPLRIAGGVCGALAIYSDQPRFFAGEELSLLTAVAEDISLALENIDAEQRRREMEERLRANYAEIEDLYNNAPCGYHSLDSDGTIVRINDTELTWLGYQRDEVVGRKITDFYTPGGVVTFNRTFPLLLQRGWVANLEVDVVRKDGSAMPVLLNAAALRDGNGDFIMTRSTMVDITERKQAEAESLRLLAAIEATDDAVVITDPVEERIQYVNNAFERITGYPRDEALGQSLHILDSGRHGSALFREIRETLLRGDVWRGRLICRRKDGSQCFEDCTYSPVRDPLGTIVNFVVVKRDITERLRLESIAESVNTMDNIGYVFSGVRHEIGNPINTLKMLLDVLQIKADTATKETVAGYLNRMTNEIDRVEFLLRSLKNFNIFETPETEALDPAAFLDSFLALIAEDFGKRGIDLTRRIELGAERMLVDPRALRQVLLNLATNAADALDGRQSPRIEFLLSKKEGRLLLRIADNGAGMTDQQQKALFKPFYTSKPKGTGLGLVIVKKMLLKMICDIEIESRYGEGTVVNILIPEASGDHA